MSTIHNINNTDSGERLSFYKLFKEKEFEIVIPIIQRDYAQGRNTTQEIRTDFINSLKKYLDEGKANRDLDFIYGSLVHEKDEKSTRFIPLDGQQRLTTLFLLHWYLAVKEKKTDSFRLVFGTNLNDGQWKSKFTYETRTSATEFCDALVSADFDLADIKPQNDELSSLSKIIKNQQWYFLSWHNDPTIQGMLVMLDALNELFKNEDKLYYDFLIDLNNPIITFQFLKLEEFGLTDDLYIKMNARGKPLTAYENFKAKFEKYLKASEFDSEKYTLGEDDNKRDVNLVTYFSHKIDTNWAKLFWAYAKDELDKKEDNQVSNDDMIINFLRTYAVNFIAGKSNSEKNVRQLIKTENKNLNYNLFEKLGCFEKTSILQLIKYLDILQNGDEKAKKYIPNYFYYDENILESFLKSNISSAVYVNRIKFHAFTQFLLRWGEPKEDILKEKLKKWMRIIYNLSENTAPYNSEKEFINSIRGINDVIEYSSDIYNFFIKENKINGFDNMQNLEEQIKACLILKSEEWTNIILKAEQHGYFNGQIGFILRLSGIQEYYNKNKNCDWSEDNNSKFKNLFIINHDKANAVFDNDGLRNSLSKDGNYIWERALLSIDDYLITEGQNKSFLIGSDRDISWKRFLKSDKENSHQRIIKNIFETLDPNDLVNSINSKIDTVNVDGWRKAFIETPGLFDYLGSKRYVRSETNHGFVLFKGERMSGGHAELYSLKFYKEYLVNKPIQPFTESIYYEAKGAETNNMPCGYITGWSTSSYQIDILFVDDRYEVWFLNISTEPFTINISELLISLGMKQSELYGYSAYFLIKETESETFQFIQSICYELKKLDEND